MHRIESGRCILFRTDRAAVCQTAVRIADDVVDVRVLLEKARLVDAEE
jgi:hypothetical protein